MKKSRIEISIPTQNKAYVRTEMDCQHQLEAKAAESCRQEQAA
ncbi:MAG: hypothetical protein AB7S38_17135 [Vulcanimicrobiota bacterium]